MTAALALAADLLDGITTADEPTAAEHRAHFLEQHPTALDLAQTYDPTIIGTPAAELVARRFRDTVLTPDGRLVLSLPPQETKTTLARALCNWLLIHNPDGRIALASYAHSLARASGRAVRHTIETHGAELGLTLAHGQANASDWTLAGHRGGMLSVGVGSALTGRAVDSLLLVDDPIRNQQDADSPTVRGALWDWWTAVARTRLAPGTPIIVIQTRWAEDDLAGRLAAEGWPVVNIPAQADGQTPDALDRPPGEWLISTRGRTPADWQAIRADVGERTWASLYQGRPAPLEGGIFKAAWFDTWRVPHAPPGCLPPTVVVDPADNEGTGDEAGIIVATAHPDTRRVFLLDDLSAAMTVGRWARVALLACVRHQAPTLAYEQSLSQLPRRVRDAWETLWQQARALRATSGNIPQAADRLTRPDDTPDAVDVLTAQLAEITGDVGAILRFGESGPRLKPIPAKGSKTLRMQLVAPMFETGRAVLVGRFPKLEHQATVWQPGQDSPDRVDAAVHACTLLGGMATPSPVGRVQDRVPTSSAGRSRASSGGGVLTRSTGRRR